MATTIPGEIGDICSQRDCEHCGAAYEVRKPWQKFCSEPCRIRAFRAQEKHPEEPTILAGDALPFVADDTPPPNGHVAYVMASTDDLSALRADMRRLQARETELQALNTTLHNARNDERTGRIAAEEQATSLQMRVDALNIAVEDWRKRADALGVSIDAAKRDAAGLRDTLHEVRTILGATSEEPIVEAARRVIAERDDEANVAQTCKDAVHTLDDVRHAVGPDDDETTVDAVLRACAERAIARADAAERLAHEAEAQREAAAAKLAAMAVLLGSTGVR